MRANSSGHPRRCRPHLLPARSPSVIHSARARPSARRGLTSSGGRRRPTCLPAAGVVHGVRCPGRLGSASATVPIRSAFRPGVSHARAQRCPLPTPPACWPLLSRRTPGGRCRQLARPASTLSTVSAPRGPPLGVSHRARSPSLSPRRQPSHPPWPSARREPTGPGAPTHVSRSTPGSPPSAHPRPVLQLRGPRPFFQHIERDQDA